LGDVLGFFAAFFFALGRWAFCWPLDEGCSPRLVPVGTGVVPVVLVELLDDDPPPECEGEVEVEVEVVPEPDEVVELVGVDDELLVGVLVVVVVVVVAPTAGVVEVDGAHSSCSEATTPVIGRPRAEMGVPGAALTWKTKVLPPTTVTVTVQSSAKAVGIAVSAQATKTAPAVATTASSLRLLIAALLRPLRWCALQ
jgi:hypothetical protein